MAEIKTDCFAYNGNSKSKPCIALDELYCKKEQCNFYKTKVDRQREKLEQERTVVRR